MSKVKYFFKEHQIMEMIALLVLFAVLDAALFVSLSYISHTGVLEGFSFFQANFIYELTTYIAVFLLAILLGVRNLYQKSKVNFRTMWLVGIPFIIPIVLNINGMGTMLYIRKGPPVHSVTEIIFGILFYLLVGLFEELYCRGILLNIVLRHLPQKTWAMWTAVIVSSLIFGLWHISNLSTGASFEGVLIQVTYAVEIGVFLAAVYLRTNSLLFVSLLHGLWDIAQSIDEIFYEYIDMGAHISNFTWSIVYAEMPFFIWGLFLLRKGVASLNGIEDNKLIHKLAFWLTFIMMLLLVAFSIFMIVYIDNMSVSEYIEFKKGFHTGLRF